MKTRKKRLLARKSRRVYIAAYLMARLSSAVEISKLIAARFRAKPVSVEVERLDRACDHGCWRFTEERDYFISTTPEKIVVYATPKKVYN